MPPFAWVGDAAKGRDAGEDAKRHEETFTTTVVHTYPKASKRIPLSRFRDNFHPPLCLHVNNVLRSLPPEPKSQIADKKRFAQRTVAAVLQKLNQKTPGKQFVPDAVVAAKKVTVVGGEYSDPETVLSALKELFRLRFISEKSPSSAVRVSIHYRTQTNLQNFGQDMRYNLPFSCERYAFRESFISDTEKSREREEENLRGMDWLERRMAESEEKRSCLLNAVCFDRFRAYLESRPESRTIGVLFQEMPKEIQDAYALVEFVEFLKVVTQAAVFEQIPSHLVQPDKISVRGILTYLENGKHQISVFLTAVDGDLCGLTSFEFDPARLKSP